jgi:hypothetical protein
MCGLVARPVAAIVSWNRPVPGAAGPAGHYTVLHPIARLDVSQVAAVKSTGRIKSC